MAASKDMLRSVLQGLSPTLKSVSPPSPPPPPPPPAPPTPIHEQPPQNFEELDPKRFIFLKETKGFISNNEIITHLNVEI